jgi:hypothetical protein
MGWDGVLRGLLAQELAEPAPGTMQPHPERRLGDPEACRRQRRGQVLPGDEQQRLPILLREHSQAPREVGVEIKLGRRVLGRRLEVEVAGSRRCSASSRLRAVTISHGRASATGTSASRRQAIAMASAAMPSGSRAPRRRA